MKELIVSLYNGNLLVKPAEPEKMVGGLFVPENARTPRSTCGEVLLAPAGLEDWVGQVVVYDQYAGRMVASEGVEAKDIVVYLSVTEVKAILACPPKALSPEMAENAIAVPGHLLVERAELPITRGKIEIPGGIHTHTKSNEAFVVDLSPEAQAALPDVRQGDRLYLSQMAGRSIAFGRREDKVLVDLPTQAVIAKLRDDGEVPVETEEHPFRHGFEVPEVDEQFHEGDRKGLL